MSKSLFLNQEGAEIEKVHSWLVENYYSEELEQEDAWDWIKGIGTGVAQGAATGSVAGPWGALAGAVLGGALGAAQTAAMQHQAPQPVTRPLQPPPPASVAYPPPSSSPATLSVHPKLGKGDFSISPQILQQFIQLLPLVTQLLSKQTSPKASKKLITEGMNEELEGDNVSDNIFPLNETMEQSNGYGIGGPIPDEETSHEPDKEVESSPTYPLVLRFVPAKYFKPMISPRSIRRIVIHITDGGPNINNTVEYFKNPMEKKKDGTIVPRKVSAHYIVGQNGEVIQMVSDNDIAWHASDANSDSIGIEHNARAPRHGQTAIYPTPVQYCSSAALVRWLCEQYSIPLDRTHILGHSEADPDTTHTDCPNSVWDWDYYMGLVTRGICLSPVSSREKQIESVYEYNRKEPLLDWILEDDSLISHTTEWKAEGFI